jgi:hypothetical protein
MTCRNSTEADRNALKTAFKREISILGGLEAAASCTRVGKSVLSEYGAIQAPASFPPVDVVLDLERIAGLPLVTECLARSQGFRLLPIELPGEGDVVEALQAVTTDVGQTMADALRACAGGLLDADLRVLDRDLGELVRAAGMAHALIRGRLGAGSLTIAA